MLGRRKIATGTAALSLLGAGLVGCSPTSGAADNASPSASVEPSASPTPRPTARYKPASEKGPAEYVRIPLLPEEANVASKEGLEAFAQHWYQTANYGYETGITDLARAISSPECITCLKYYDVVERGFIDDDWMANSEIEVLQVHSDYVLTPEGRYQALVYLRQEAMEYYGPEGLQYEGEAGVGAVQLFEGVWEGDHWVAANIATISEIDKCRFHPEDPDC